MKTLTLILGIVCCGLAIQLHAQSVPAPVKAAFEAKHPGMTPEWEQEGSHYEAEYMANGREHSIVFTSAGALVSEEMEIHSKELPASITEYVKTHLGNQKIDEAARINQADGKVIYEAEVGGKDYLFDDKGTPLGTEDEEEDEDADGNN